VALATSCPAPIWVRCAVGAHGSGGQRRAATASTGPNEVGRIRCDAGGYSRSLTGGRRAIHWAHRALARGGRAVAAHRDSPWQCSCAQVPKEGHDPSTFRIRWTVDRLDGHAWSETDMSPGLAADKRVRAVRHNQDACSDTASGVFGASSPGARLRDHGLAHHARHRTRPPPWSSKSRIRRDDGRTLNPERPAARFSTAGASRPTAGRC